MNASPRLHPAVRVLAGTSMIVALFLCRWQVIRDGERNAGRQRAIEVENEPVLRAPLGQEASVAWRLVEWRGHFDGKPQLVAGRMVADVLGYGVVQRFVTADAEPILVDRGWVPVAGLDDTLRTLETEGSSTLIGQLRPITGSEIVSPVSGHGTQIWPPKSWPALAGAGEANRDLYVLEGASGGQNGAKSPRVSGFDRVPARDDTSLHYASQWLALAVLSGIVLVPGAMQRARHFLGA